jgi:diaminopropionate ammonia-lyase
LRPLTLATATDGNHGRAVARMAALLDLGAHIFVPDGTAQARIEAIAGEGADVTVVDGTYDDAVALAARQAGERCIVASDTSWPGYEEFPRRVIDGYSTILREVDAQLAAQAERGPDLVLVQIGVGALAAAVTRHYRRPDLDVQPLVVGVEPTRAACALTSIWAGRIVSIPGPHDSIMAGLNAGTPSPVAWPVISTGIDLFVAVEDERAREAMRLLAAERVTAGETGAAGLAGLLGLLTGPEAERMRARLDVGSTTRVLLVCTEGATDPASYREIVGHDP